MKKYSKYDLYEKAVQSADTHAEWVESMYKDLNGCLPQSLREDFCGTFQICCEWVKRNPKYTAVGYDLDPEPIAFGKKKHYSRLKPHQKNRVKIQQKDVLKINGPKTDLIIVGNFSFFIFKQRAELLAYFKNCLKGLKKNGTVILEMAGGPGMISYGKETKTVRLGKSYKYTYIWDQKDFNPINHNGEYAIHFKLPDGTRIKNAFQYDWRLWTIPEIRDVFAEAGFASSHVFWESEHKGEGTGEYIRAEFADNAYSWIAYVVGKAK